MKETKKSHDNLRSKQKREGRKPYVKPALTEFGSVKEFTQSATTTGMSDGGSAPVNFKKTCVAPVSVIEEHRLLLQDEKCQSLFRRAIFEKVKPGDVVLDLGSGIGLHALFACQAGAKKVYAIESGGIIEASRKIAHENGFGEKIQFLTGDSTCVELPEKVDVIVTNVGFLNTMKSLPDAFQRFLKPGGCMIPSKIQLFCSPVGDFKAYRKQVECWNSEIFNLKFASVRPYAENSAHGNRFDVSDFIASRALLNPFDLSEQVSQKYEWDIDFRALKDGHVYGLAIGYDFHLTNEIILSTFPPVEYSPDFWRQTFLPFQEPLPINEGERIDVKLAFYPRLDIDYPFWAWKCQAGNMTTLQNDFKGQLFTKGAFDKIQAKNNINVSL